MLLLNNRRRNLWVSKRWFVIVALFLFCMVEGCYTTKVRVNTNPPGAVAHYDFKPVGTTPLEFETDWYGKHKLTLDHPEHGRRVEYVELTPPAYLWFPFDFLTAIMPFNVTDTQEFTFDMTEPQQPETEENHEPEGTSS